MPHFPEQHQQSGATGSFISTSIAYSNVFKLEKKAKKRKTHGKSKSKTSKPKNKRKQNKWEINGKAKRKKGKTWTCPFAFLLFFLFFRCVFLLLFVALFLLFFACCLEKKSTKTSKIKANKKQIEKAK